MLRRAQSFWQGRGFDWQEPEKERTPRAKGDAGLFKSAVDNFRNKQVPAGMTARGVTQFLNQENARGTKI